MVRRHSRSFLTYGSIIFILLVYKTRIRSYSLQLTGRKQPRSLGNIQILRNPFFKVSLNPLHLIHILYWPILGGREVLMPMDTWTTDSSTKSKCVMHRIAISGIDCYNIKGLLFHCNLILVLAGAPANPLYLSYIPLVSIFGWILLKIYDNILKESCV